MSELELSECYTQIYVNGRMVGSGFFLEDVKGWHRNYYLVTDHHVYSLARQAEAATGRGMVLATRDWWTRKTQFALLGTSESIALPMRQNTVRKISRHARCDFRPHRNITFASPRRKSVPHRVLAILSAIPLRLENRRFRA